MSSLLPPEIEISERGDVTRIRMPPRQLGPWRWIGLLPLLFGLAFALGPLSWALQAVNFKRFDPCSLIFVVFTIPFIWGGLQLARIGLLILAANSEVLLRRDELVAIERCGPVTWTRKLPLESIRRFVVQSGAAETQRGTAAPTFLHELAAIQVESASEKKALLLTPGFPPKLLLPLAEELARRCNVGMEQRQGQLEQPVEVVKHLTPGDLEPPVSLKQPDDSDIEVEEAADGVTLNVPPSGVWAGSKGLMVFSMFWNGFMAIITGAFAFADNGPKGNDLWIVIPFIGLFWAVGIGMLLGAINMGKRRAVLAVVGDQLLAMQTGIFGGKRAQWRKDELLDVRTGPSGVEVNDEPVIELQIVPLKGQKFGLLSGRNVDELRWVAATLRQALRIQWQADGTAPFPFREQDVQPDTSDVVQDQRVDGVTLNVPPAGIWSGSKGLLIVALAWNLIIGIITAVLIGVMFHGASDVWIGLLFLSVFWLIGLALLLGAIHMGTRRAVLAVVGQELLVMQTGIFGKKEHHWQANELEDIRTGPSGMSVNNQPILELHVLPKLGPKVGMLAGRDNDELAWLATVLRRALKLPKEMPAEKPEATGDDA